jgi:Sulfotransferase domain
MIARVAHRLRVLARIATAWGRPGPDFVIAGFQKCGTTSLYNYLLRHPGVAPATKRSIKYFDHGPNWAKGRLWYRSHFPFAPARSVPTGRRLVGESTPSYIVHPRGPQRLQKAAPQTRLIVLLRDPVERAYSAYHHMRRRGRETLTFEEALDREVERVGVEHARLASDPHFVAHHYRLHSYLGWGRYAEHLQPWLQVLERCRILILLTEDLAADPDRVLAGVLAFLGLPAISLDEYPRLNVGRYHAMEPRVRERLVGYFAPHNRRLAGLLGRDPGWPT